MKKILILISFFLLYSCNSGKTPEELWMEGKKLRSEGKTSEAISIYKQIINLFPDNDLAANSQFQIADVYLNDLKDYEFSIDEFNKVIQYYPENDNSKKSLFMIGYIYNNYLDAYSDAIFNYENFLTKYPNDELSPSVKYELEGLNEIKSTIKSLIKN